MFRGKESSNRIELSQLVQELLNFGVFGFLWLLGVGLFLGGGGVVGGCPYTCAHKCACMHAHASMVNMVISCKWPPHWGNPWEFPMMSYTHACACTCMQAHACAHGWGCALSPPPTPIPHPRPPRGDPKNNSKFNST